jgi:hypothetical protein
VENTAAETVDSTGAQSTEAAPGNHCRKAAATHTDVGEDEQADLDYDAVIRPSLDRYGRPVITYGPVVG